MDKAVVNDNAIPPVEVVYHCNAVPAATRLVTVAPLLKVCEDADGAEVVFTVTDTAVLALSIELTVCDT